jgi:hypothetical protein
MELLSFVTAKPGSRRLWAPFTASTPSTPVPVNGDLSNIQMMPVAQSGMERAAWWETNRVKTGDATLTTCSAGRPSIGTMERQLLGSTRSEYEGGVILRDHNWFDFPDQVTQNSSSVPQIWNAQVSSSDGLWDGNNEIYVSMDSTTIWA